MKEKAGQMFKDKLFLVMLILGLLTIIAVAGVITVQGGRGNEINPYLEMPQPETITQETASEMPQVAGVSDAAKEIQKSGPTPTRTAVAQDTNQEDDLVAEASAGKDTTDVLVLNFTDTSKMEWPVKGNVFLDYSVDQAVYSSTLDQCKCNPGLVIQSGMNTPVGALANARILEADSSEEIGDYTVMDLGNEYIAICGQLKEVYAAGDEYLKRGQTLGYVSGLTKYYSVEDVNVFSGLKHQDKAVDPLDYMKQGPENYR